MNSPKRADTSHLFLTSVVFLAGILLASTPFWVLWVYRAQLPFPEPVLSCLLMVVPAMSAIHLLSLAKGKTSPFNTWLIVNAFIVSSCTFFIACVVFRA